MRISFFVIMCNVLVWFGRNTDEIGPAKIGEKNLCHVGCTPDCFGIRALVFEIQADEYAVY